MQDKQQLITLAFVLIIGLLGGYMLGQHEGDDDRGEMHREDDRMVPQEGMPASTTLMQGSADVHVE